MEPQDRVLLPRKAYFGMHADPRVLDVVEQPPKVTYVDDRGVRRSHTVDLLVTWRDGTRVAVLVKPRAKAAKIDLERLLQLLRTQVPRSFADRWMHLDEGSLTRDVVDRGQMILRVKTDGPFADDHAVLRMAEIVDRPMRVADALAAAGAAAGFWTIVRLVADGRLNTRGRVRLDMDSIVQPTQEQFP